MSLTETGVGVTSEIPANAKIMMLTAISYLVIQIPGFFETGSESNNAKDLHVPALIALIISFLSFVLYSWYQVYSANSIEAQKKLKQAKL